MAQLVDFRKSQYKIKYIRQKSDNNHVDRYDQKPMGYIRQLGNLTSQKPGI